MTISKLGDRIEATFFYTAENMTVRERMPRLLKKGAWVLSLLLVCSACQLGTEGNTQILEGESVSRSGLFCGGDIKLPDISTLPAPKLRTNIGSAEMKITTSVPEAQSWFNQGLNLLHGFWYLEAYRAFQQVILLDPDCAMGYWGVAMCQPGFGGSPSRWQSALREAHRRKAGISELEEAFIQATDVLLYQGGKASIPFFERIVELYPNNPEAIAFTALMKRQSVQTEAQSNEVKAILEKALRRFPDHTGLQHYYIHVMEVRPDFASAKPVALQLVQQAPGIPHLLHMPGHLYFLEGNYAKVVEYFEQARAVEQHYQTEANIPRVADQNYLHNLHFLAVTYAELNNYEKALDLAKRYAYIQMKEGQLTNSNEFILLYKGKTLPAWVQIRFRKYDKALEALKFLLNVPAYAGDHPLFVHYLKVMKKYCEGMSAILAKDEATAIRASKSMKKEITAFQALANNADRSTEEMIQLNETYDIMMMAWYELVGWGVNMDAAGAFIHEPWEEAFALEEAIGYTEPPRLMYPVAESLMHLHLERKDTAAAREAYMKALKKRPDSPAIREAFSNGINQL